MATYSTTIGNGLFLRVTTTVNSTSIENNTKNVTTRALLVTTVGYLSASATKYGTLTVDGTPYSFSKVIGNLGTNSTLELYSVTKDIKHNTDGSKNLTVNCSFSINITYSGVYKGTITAGGTETLQTIPRASKVTCNSFNVGDSTTINIDRASSSFTHTLTYTFGSASGTITTKTTNLNIGWTPTAATLYAQMPNSTSKIGTITCTTYNGNTVIGTSSTTFTAYTLSSRCLPDTSATILDTNSKVTEVTGSNTTIVKYLSKPHIYIYDEAKNSATISARYISCADGQYSPTREVTFNNGITNHKISVTSTDSRTYSNTYTYDLISMGKWVNYVKTEFTKATAIRPESTSNSINLSIVGHYYNGWIGGTQNSLSLKYRFKESERNWSDYINLTPTITGNTFSCNISLSNMSYQNQYTFEIIAEDKLMSANSGEKIVPKGKGIVTVGDGYVKVNGALRDYLGKNILNGLSVYSGGFLNPDETLEELILTQIGTPNGSFWYVRTMFYSSKSTSSNRTQVAYPYNNNFPSYFRYYFNGSWSNWKVISGAIMTSSADTGTATVGELSVEWGKVVVTPVANTPTNISFNFNKTYQYAPTVMCVASTGVIGTGVLGVSVVATSTTGATLGVYRINNVPTGIHFLIIGKVD